MAQVVGAGADRVRAVPGVDQVRQEPSDRHDVLAGVVEQYHPPDDAALALLDHPHTGLPCRCSLHQAAALTSWRQPSRCVEITENSATMATA
jgi:hypothetical protein